MTIIQTVYHNEAPDPTGPAAAALARMRQAWMEVGPLPGARRMALLGRLSAVLLERQDAVVRALSDDFGHRSGHETRMADILPVVEGIRHARRNLKRWMRPQRRPIAPMFRPGRGFVLRQPLGVVGIVGPWNYPIQLTLGPLAAAIAAGNRALVKPSELTPRTADLLDDIVRAVFRDDEVAVVTGGPEAAAAFTRLRFDHLLYTGSTAVGRHVMRAAAENLVPVTLELGGKSPAIVAPDYPVEKAAAAIAAGKLFNAGQTCIAPDYALVPRAAIPAFVAAFRAEAGRLYPRFAGNPDYSAIVNDRHYSRIADLVADAAARGATVVAAHPDGAASDPARRKMAPTIVTDVPPAAAILHEEIFGPVLPVLPYDALSDCFAHVNAGPRPLALYLFSHDEESIHATLERTVSGGVTLNDTLLHCVQEELPFGGVGESGMGAYHGEAGFRTFSHEKSVFRQSRWNLAALSRPPYGARIEAILRFILRR